MILYSMICVRWTGIGYNWFTDLSNSKRMMLCRLERLILNSTLYNHEIIDGFSWNHPYNNRISVLNLGNPSISSLKSTGIWDTVNLSPGYWELHRNDFLINEYINLHLCVGWLLAVSDRILSSHYNYSLYLIL